MNLENEEKIFGKEYFISPTNEERRYLGLDPILEQWDTTRFCSKVNITYTRTTVFWSGTEIRKIIQEEFRVPEGCKQPIQRYIVEHDTILRTEDRKMLLPLTARGRKKPVTASNILAVTPLGSSFSFMSKEHPSFI